MKDYSKLSEQDKKNMIWPIGTKVKRIPERCNQSGTFNPDHIYITNSEKKYNSDHVAVLMEDGCHNGGLSSSYFIIIALPEDELQAKEAVINTYPIY